MTNIPPAPKPPDGTVIIVNYQSRDHVERCLNSLKPLLLKCRRPALNEAETSASPEPLGSKSDASPSPIISRGIKVIVVDNDSGGNEADSIASAFPEVRVIAAGSNLGFGGGNNLALPEAEGGWVMFLNPDTQVKAGAIESLAAYLSSNPRFGGVAPAIVDERGGIALSYYPFTNIFTSLLAAAGLHRVLPFNRVNRRWKLTYRAAQCPIEIDRALGAALMISRAALDSVGGFDESFFLYSEEEDLCCRLRQAGWKIDYYPLVRIHHQGGVSMRRKRALAVAAANWSRYLYLRKHYSRLSSELSRWIWIIALVLRLGAASALPGESRADRIRGYYWSIRSLLDRGWFDRALRPPAKDVKS